MGSSSSHPVPGENSEQYNTFFNEKFKIKVCLSVCLFMVIGCTVVCFGWLKFWLWKGKFCKKLSMYWVCLQSVF